MGNEVEQLCEVGLAALHRLLAHRDVFTRARVLFALHGRRTAQCGGSSDLSANVCRLWWVIWRTCCTLKNAEFLLAHYVSDR
jgi:hypothetical protein